MDSQWRALSEEILSGMKEWRLAHPQATLREIEQAAAERVSHLQARMVQDAASASAMNQWQQQPQEARPTCPRCATATALVARGQQTRRLQSAGGREIELRRTYGTCPSCGMGFFPPG
jgi:RNase P subunit RPR2